MRSILFISLFLWSNLIVAQEADKLWIKGDFKTFSIDHLGYIYAITSKDQQLRKFKPNGDSMTVFNDVKRYGKLASINTQNPLRTLLFYKDFRTVVVLDRFLQTVNVLSLRKMNLFQTEVIAPSYDNHIWIFDQQETKLKKISEAGKLLTETADLRLVVDEVPLPVELFDQNGFVYLYDPEKGMYIFDYYGALKGRIALLGWDHVQVVGKTIMGLKEGKWLQYTTGSLDIKENILPELSSTVRDLQLTSTGIFILDERGIRLLTY